MQRPILSFLPRIDSERKLRVLLFNVEQWVLIRHIRNAPWAQPKSMPSDEKAGPEWSFVGECRRSSSIQRKCRSSLHQRKACSAIRVSFDGHIATP
jgi:hypothetical protein